VKIQYALLGGSSGSGNRTNAAGPSNVARKFVTEAFRQDPWYFLLSAVALIYALIAGLRTLGEYDLFWQMATGRWVAQHHAVFSTDVFSYTAQGQPWIYPVGSGLLFYWTFLLGGYALISWLGALSCVTTIALLLRRGSAVTAVLAIIAVPLIAARTSPRADMFTVVLFAAFLSILWEQFEAGTAKLWLLPLLMVLWVNLHLGFVAGLALICAYFVAELARTLNPAQKNYATGRLKLALPWLTATFFATLVNPWGWNIYRALLRQNAAMAVHSERITEWVGLSFTSSTLKQALSARDPASSGEWILFVAILAIMVAAFRRQWPPAMLLVGALAIALRHVRLLALLACVVVVVGGAVLSSALDSQLSRVPDRRLYSIVDSGLATILVLLCALRCVDLVSNRYYFSSPNEIRNFGAGLSWWFPERAIAFIEREHLPPQILNTYEEGGFLLWRLGAEYRDYTDGRAIPFGPTMFNHLQEVLESPPDSFMWQRETEKYEINTVVLSVARYDGLRFVGSVLSDWCASDNWRPVYLDEVSAVFVRRTPKTEALVAKFSVHCSSVTLPAEIAPGNRAGEFNRHANAAALLLALQRDQEAASSSAQALSIFPDSAALWYIRGKALLLTGDLANAERDLLQSAHLEPNVATWSALADLYRNQRRYPPAANALEQLVTISPHPTAPLILLGYTYLQTNQPQEAMKTFNRAEGTTPPNEATPARAEINNGRAFAWSALGNLNQAVSAQERAVQLSPQNATYWRRLAQLYSEQGRTVEATQASERAEALNGER
jgi:cytochrome c-type biogenesis protein CcmH/NrfG